MEPELDGCMSHTSEDSQNPKPWPGDSGICGSPGELWITAEVQEAALAGVEPLDDEEDESDLDFESDEDEVDSDLAAVDFSPLEADEEDDSEAVPLDRLSVR